MATVTVKRKGESLIRDVEVSPELPISQLSAQIAHDLGWDKTSDGSIIEFLIEVYPPGRILNGEETLIDARVEDGSWLVFSPILPASELRNSGKFTWKRLDKE